jgi:hypothetical protein
VNIKIPYRVGLALLLLAAPLWSQVDTTVPAPAVTGLTNGSEDRMLTPPPVSGQSYPVALASEERSNYLRGGLAFSAAYADNVLGATGTGTKPVSDVSYSVWPTLALDETTPRLHWTLTYAPGFTFYQRVSARNEADQNAAIEFQYRLSPHVTLSMRDGFQKTSSVFNQPDLAAAGAVSGGAEGANNSVIAPISDRLSNSGNVGISYQFSANAMVGASGTFTNLHYPNSAQVPGLFDSSSQSGSAFYTHRVSKMHYIGASYQYQRLLSYPTQGQNETQTHAVLFFYTLYATSRFSISTFGGPQHANIGPQFFAGASAPQPGSQTWTPAAGASVNWQGQFTSVAASYSHVIASGGGLIGAVHTDSASLSVRQQLARALSASLSGGYAQNKVVGGLSQTTGASTNGHSISGTASLQRQFGEHLGVQLGYTRLHQTYNVLAISATPDTNREFVSVSYQFSRPLGR